jgi:hypothetical protein
MMKILHEQRSSWKFHDKNFFVLKLYYVDDESKMNVNAPQLMCCVIC